MALTLALALALALPLSLSLALALALALSLSLALALALALALTRCCEAGGATFATECLESSDGPAVCWPGCAHPPPLTLGLTLPYNPNPNPSQVLERLRSCLGLRLRWVYATHP